MRFRPIRLFFALAAGPSVARAQPTAGSELAAPSIDALTLLGLGGSLVLVIAAILFAGWAYSRVRGLNSGPSTVISVLAAKPLGPKERIVLVQIGDQQLALGVTQGSLNTLHVFDEHVIELPKNLPSIPFANKLRGAFEEMRSK
jgi:flagellar protein FliO/FliZ